MKKVISFSLCLILLLSALIIPASAQNTELIKEPDKKFFYEGIDWVYSGSTIKAKIDFDLTGTVIRYNGNDISYKVFPWGGNMYIEPSSGNWKAGKNTARIYLEDFSNAYVDTQITLVAIKSVSLAKDPDKTKLMHGVDWDYDSKNNIALKSYSPTGAAIKLTFTDGTTSTVSYEDGGIDWIVPNNVDDFVLGKNTLNLTFYGHYIPFTVEFVLKEIESISVKNKPSKQNYEFKDDWSYSGEKIVADYDFSGLKVGVTYTDGTTETVAYSSDPDRFSFTYPSKLTFGSNSVKVSVDGKKSAEFVITIRGYGDINFDGQVNSNDALSVLQYSVNLVKFNIVKFKYADVTGDGKVNSSDALAILQKATGNISYFKAELV